MTPPNSPILELRNVTTLFPTRRGDVWAVNGANLALYPGQILGLVGESGCGKSTIARLIVGLYAPFNLQRRLAMGLIIPLVYFAVRPLEDPWLYRVPQRWRAPAPIEWSPPPCRGHPSRPGCSRSWRVDAGPAARRHCSVPRSAGRAEAPTAAAAAHPIAVVVPTAAHCSVRPTGWKRCSRHLAGTADSAAPTDSRQQP